MVPDLIYDVGMNDGSDTAYYLSKGYRVVAIEANPILVEQAQVRFASDIADGQLTLLGVGVGAEDGIVPFWINDERSEWSSFVKEFACQNGTSCHQIDVQCVRFRDVLEEHGVPYYLKVDVEGSDLYCLRDLSPNDLPQYISVEAHHLEYLCVLHELGYNAFKCLNQIAHNDQYHQRRENERVLRNALTAIRWRAADSLAACLDSMGFVKSLLRRTGILSLGRKLVVPRPVPVEAEAEQWIFPPGSSGPFGEDTYGEWESLEEVAYNWLHYRTGHKTRGTLNMDGWYDFHAKRENI